MTRTALFPAPEQSASLYVGRVMHARMKPVSHRFQYQVFSLLIDLDRQQEAARLSRFCSIGRFNLFSFKQTDHGAKTADLRAYVNSLFKSEGLAAPAKVMLLCYPRILNFAFNPISVYFCYDASGEITALIYEVRNTFKQRHSYFAPVVPGEIAENGVRQERDKLFYVSPFMDMAMRYKFRILPPGQSVALRILETDADGPVLSATFFGEQRLITDANLLRLFFSLPLHNLKIVAGINWEALQLWIKGMKLVQRPEKPLPISIAGIAKDTPKQP